MRTSKTFFYPTARKLWKHCNTLMHLAKCLPESCIRCPNKSLEEGGRIVVTRHLTADDVARFWLYACLVRTLDFHLASVGVEHKSLQTIQTALPNQGIILFRNLQTLHYIGPSLYSDFLPHLVPPTLEAIHMMFLPDDISDIMVPHADANIELAVLGVQNRHPTLAYTTTSLSLSCMFGRVQGLADIIRGWDSLKELVVVSNMDSVVLAVIFALPRLQQLTMCLPLSGQQALVHVPGTHAVCESLRTLKIAFTPLDAAAVKTVLASLGTARLNELMAAFMVDNQTNTIGSVCAAIEACCAADTLQKIHLMSLPSVFRVQDAQHSGTWTLADIRPLLGYRNLSNVHLQPPRMFSAGDGDFRRMADAWPDLQSLRLGHTTDGLPACTLSGLIPLAQYAPRLRTLSIMVDATTTAIRDDTLSSFPVQESLVTLDVQLSPISAPADVAEFLSRLFPCLREIKVLNGREAEVEIIRRRLWEDVEVGINARWLSGVER